MNGNMKNVEWIKYNFKITIIQTFENYSQIRDSQPNFGDQKFDNILKPETFVADDPVNEIVIQLP